MWLAHATLDELDKSNEECAHYRRKSPPTSIAKQGSESAPLPPSFTDVQRTCGFKSTVAWLKARRGLFETFNKIDSVDYP